MTRPDYLQSVLAYRENMPADTVYKWCERCDSRAFGPASLQTRYRCESCRKLTCSECARAAAVEVGVYPVHSYLCGVCIQGEL